MIQVIYTCARIGCDETVHDLRDALDVDDPLGLPEDWAVDMKVTGDVIHCPLHAGT